MRFIHFTQMNAFDEPELVWVNPRRVLWVKATGEKKTTLGLNYGGPIGVDHPVDEVLERLGQWDEKPDVAGGGP